MAKFKLWLTQWRQKVSNIQGVKSWRLWVALVGGLLLALVLLGWYWSQEPERFDVVAHAKTKLPDSANGMMPPGWVMTSTLDEVTRVLMEKPGGYLRNDVTPPSLWLDNIPSWEEGVIYQIRDMSRALRRDFSRSQTQSAEDSDLALAEPQFSVDFSSWMLPAAESEYQQGRKYLQAYRLRLLASNEDRALFYARADSLNRWLADVQTRVGSLSQELSASVAREATAEFATEQTPWLKIDNVFYEARGQSWALLHLMRAVEYEFSDVLKKKEALVSLQQIIRELEATQESIYSPVILNGNGFGVFANHSLVMANYLSRASAAIGDLRELLANG